MAQALVTMETDCIQYAAVSVLPWAEESALNNMTDFDLTHDFIMMNLSQTQHLQYNEFLFNSADTAFSLRLRDAGLKTKLHRNLSIVKKYLPTGGNNYPLHTNISTLVPEIDSVVISLHHDSSSHLPYPGPYLMEHYLLHKSCRLFPNALSPLHPVLVIDNYVSLGPNIHVTLVNSDNKNKLESGIKFGGLLLYLCEGKLTAEHCKKFNFVSGACVCIVTRNCKKLVQEVGRLDLEGKWKFRLRDEYQTACSDKMKPLFFLIGRFDC